MSSLAAARSRTAVVGRLSSEIGEAIVVSPAKYQASGFSVLLFMALTGLGRLESALKNLGSLGRCRCVGNAPAL